MSQWTKEHRERNANTDLSLLLFLFSLAMGWMAHSMPQIHGRSSPIHLGNSFLELPSLALPKVHNTNA